ncbi:hypothetical protein [Marinagarivorans cellulosilyticus]|uniref:hypothetical protein n=1 Tax=Marinagarivorans cellulosilyticus TaxID=2721545 RepID=UPI001F327E67|nr:hypothetical protein [Marinagarivorans cellulosilyticus]
MLEALEELGAIEETLDALSGTDDDEETTVADELLDVTVMLLEDGAVFVLEAVLEDDEVGAPVQAVKPAIINAKLL